MTLYNESSKSGTEMDTLSQVLEYLRNKKIDLEFRWIDHNFIGKESKKYSPGDLTIIKTYRFEGDSNPDDSSILYILETNDGIIGYSIDSYGIYSNYTDQEGYNNFIRQIKINHEKGQKLFE